MESSVRSQSSGQKFWTTYSHQCHFFPSPTAFSHPWEELIVKSTKNARSLACFLAKAPLLLALCSLMPTECWCSIKCKHTKALLDTILQYNNDYQAIWHPVHMLRCKLVNTPLNPAQTALQRLPSSKCRAPSAGGSTLLSVYTRYITHDPVDRYVWIRIGKCAV